MTSGDRSTPVSREEGGALSADNRGEAQSTRNANPRAIHAPRCKPRQARESPPFLHITHLEAIHEVIEQSRFISTEISLGLLLQDLQQIDMNPGHL